MSKRLFFAATGLALLLQPAMADTRDDVLAAMQRCQAMPDDRSWLDCTYGAEQPMRAKLGLVPAPEFQQRLVPPATAYYPPSSYPVPSASADARPRKPAPLAHRKASFMQILTGSATPVAVSTIDGFQYDSQGAFTITLHNGQVWRQVDVVSGSKARLRGGASVTIKPGALGSYNMLADGDPHAYKVEPRS